MSDFNTKAHVYHWPRQVQTASSTAREKGACVSSSRDLCCSCSLGTTKPSWGAQNQREGDGNSVEPQCFLPSEVIIIFKMGLTPLTSDTSKFKLRTKPHYKARFKGLQVHCFLGSLILPCSSSKITSVSSSLWLRHCPSHPCRHDLGHLRSGQLSDTWRTDFINSSWAWSGTIALMRVACGFEVHKQKAKGKECSLI